MIGRILVSVFRFPFSARFLEIFFRFRFRGKKFRFRFRKSEILFPFSFLFFVKTAIFLQRKRKKCKKHQIETGLKKSMESDANMVFKR